MSPMIERGDFRLVLARAPLPEELRQVEADEKMLLNVLDQASSPLAPCDDWITKYLYLVRLWPSQRMAVGWAVGETCEAFAERWITGMEKALADLPGYKIVGNVGGALGVSAPLFADGGVDFDP